MAILLVTYDLKYPGDNYEKLLAAIKATNNWAKLGGSAYLVKTPEDPDVMRDRLLSSLNIGDQLYVGVARAPSAWYGLSDDVSRWILANQT